MLITPRRTRHAAAVLTALLVVAGCSSDDGGSTSGSEDTTAADTTPTTTTAVPRDVVAGDVEGPIDGEYANAMPPGLADQYGYVEEEYFISGDAGSYASDGPLTDDGMWSVEAGATAPYTTRVVVRRPADLADFNGTVAVEWFNVTAGVDGDPDFGLLSPLLLSEGYAYVGVSAQQVGVEGGGGALPIPGAPAGALVGLKERDPERYGDLTHPGDAFSYDIYAQVAGSAWSGDLLDGTVPAHVLAVGESQSAFRLVSFIDAVQPVTNAFDGFLVHSRGAGGAALGDDPASNPGAQPVAIRSDLDVPVLQFETETDLVGLGFLAARQPDTDGIATWEVAGTAHADATILEYGQAANAGTDFDLGAICGNVNDGPQAQVLRAGFAALTEWVIDGTPPPTSPLMETTAGALDRNADGNVLGGIRTPDVDAPIATLTGQNSADSVICSLFGETIPFTSSELADHYPTHDDYVTAVTDAADAAVEAGFVLPADRDAFVDDAEIAPVPA